MRWRWIAEIQEPLPPKLIIEDHSNKGELPMSILISLLITILVIFLVLYLINMLPLDGRAKQIARVIVIIIGIVSLLKYLAVF
jgi:hypothetical protein